MGGSTYVVNLQSGSSNNLVNIICFEHEVRKKLAPFAYAESITGIARSLISLNTSQLLLRRYSRVRKETSIRNA